MKINLDEFEQSIEDNAGKFAPLSESENAEIETIINAAVEAKNSTIRISAYDVARGTQKVTGVIGR